MTFQFHIPLANGTDLPISLPLGETLFILGANGAGKSSLVHRIYAQHVGMARHISAHRQTWFSSSSIDISPQQKRSTEDNIRNLDAQPTARWRDDYSAARATIAIFDLIDAQNVRARAIAEAFDRGDIGLCGELSKKAAPITVINELLRLSNLPITISVRENEQVVAQKFGSEEYSAAELSDGERNALLIAAAVLTAKPGTLLIVDEPERHLHRSIISPLLTQLFARRKDCAFVVSTHDVNLPVDNPRARVLLVRGCNYVSKSVSAWDADLATSIATVDDTLKRDILGARKKVLFVEGTEQSLDLALYSLVFPDISIIPKAGCTEVEQAVMGIRGSGDLHWVRAWGIVDNDRRTDADIRQLKHKGVFALSVHSVEAIYFHTEIQRRLAIRQAEMTGETASELVQRARDAAIEELQRHIPRLSRRALTKWARDEMFRHLPTKQDLDVGATKTVTIDLGAEIAREATQLTALLSSGNLKVVVEKYPVRETGALDLVVSKLGFKSRGTYEMAVRKLVADDIEVLSFIRSLFGDLPSALAAE